VRDYGKVASTFWTGHTGRLLRGDRDAQIVALYLLTGPMANMIGLYHLPLAMLADQTGMKTDGAIKALRRVCETGFARFEGLQCMEGTSKPLARPFEGGLEHVFVPEMAAYQIGEPLHPKDKRVTGIISLWQSFRKCEFYLDFHKRYAASFHLPKPSPFEAPSKPGAGAGAGFKQDAPETGDGGAPEKEKTKADDRFSRFWKAYPRKAAKKDAAKAFASIDPPDELLADMLGAIDRQKKTHDWTKERGQFIPYPATWLRAGQWEDQQPEVMNGKHEPAPPLKPLPDAPPMDFRSGK